MAVAAVSGILAAGLTACGGSSSTGTDSGPSVKFDQGSHEVVNPSDHKGGTITYASSKDFDSTDPGNTYMAKGVSFDRYYVRTLTTYASLPGTGGNKLVPDLATSLGQVSPDGLTWTYHLRPGIKFEDGSPVTAKDVKYAVARSLDRKILGKGPSYYAQYLDFGKYPGPFQDKNLDDFKGVTTPDDLTVVFHLKTPMPDWDGVVLMQQSAPVPAAKDTGADYYKHPVSTGPYMWQGDYVPRKGGTLVPNPNWDPKTDPNRKQLPAKVVVLANVPPDEIDNRLLAGTVDIGVEGTGVQANARAKILKDPNLKAHTDDSGDFHWYLPIDTQVITNLDCRKAVIYAADRDAMWRAYGGDYGGTMSTSWMPPSISGRQPSSIYPAQPGYHGDVTKAKEELAKCGQPNGFKTAISFRTDRPKEKATAEALQQSLGRVGIQLEIKSYPSDTYTTDQVGSPAFMKKEGIGIAVYGWAADFPTGFGYLQALSDKAAIVDSGNSNVSMLDDPQINQWWKDVVKVQDPAAREKIYNQIDQKALELGALIPNVYAKSLIYRGPKLTNVYYHAGFTMYDYVNLGKSA